MPSTESVAGVGEQSPHQTQIRHAAHLIPKSKMILTLKCSYFEIFPPYIFWIKLFIFRIISEMVLLEGSWSRLSGGF